jgi:hypothetical protein
MTARPVWLIDDDDEWCARVCRLLAPHGIPVVSMGTLAAGLSRVDEIGRPAAVVMDAASRCEHSAGVEALRHDATLRHVPIGFVKKTAALDAVLLMLTSSAAGAASHRAA